MSPLLIQDARQIAEFAAVKASKVGFTRYLGVPVHDADGLPAGTLCIIDNRSGEPLDEHDERFVSLMGMRISAELAREQHLKARLSEKDRELARRQHDLEETHGVLSAMNQAFEALGACETLDDLLREQTRLLRGVTGATSAAVLIASSEVTRGFFAPSGKRKPALWDLPSTPGHPPLEVVIEDAEPLWAMRLKCRYARVARLPEVDGGAPMVLLGYEEAPADDERHTTYLRAIADQIYLLLAAFRLQRRLVESNQRLQDTHLQMVQSEKLSAAGALAATTAHDIRNIVASLTLLTSDPCADPEAALGSVREQLDRFNTLAHRLLAYSKPRHVEMRPVDVVALLEGVLALTGAQLRISGVEASIEAQPRLAPVAGDAHQLEHLFVNLTLNATQAMHPSGGTLRFRVEAHGRMARIRVSDTGSGISGDPAALFEPFASTRTDGFGLGLFSCRRIAEEHGGALSARNNRGAGATFVVELPVRVTE